MYPRQHYWRGKVWGPINWLVYQGFKIHDWDREAQLLAASSAKMFLKPWREKGECQSIRQSDAGRGRRDRQVPGRGTLYDVAISNDSLEVQRDGKRCSLQTRRLRFGM